MDRWNWMASVLTSGEYMNTTTMTIEAGDERYMTHFV